MDYYNYGVPNGTVFEVAAKMNNVQYNVNDCCGVKSAAPALVAGPNVISMLVLVATLHLIVALMR